MTQITYWNACLVLAHRLSLPSRTLRATAGSDISAARSENLRKLSSNEQYHLHGALPGSVTQHTVCMAYCISG
jgi:hypothetical protein